MATAEHLYEQCNGMEYEASSAKLDLRYVCDTERLGLCSEYKVGVDFERDKIYIYVVNILVVQVDYSSW